ncbi:hypothetical protein [Zunongwangia sp.]|uniref:hypothetical protein n=1 Tax=Zunongwangia sp. TaxID=1965325 RepID=UPI003AA96EB3
MKTKINVLLLLIACTGFFTSCSSDDDSLPSESAVVGMSSFGFYQEDNDQLVQDYVIEELSGNSISFALPSQVDVTNLVARFTTTENDIVTVGGANQMSGETANDYSAAVEYLLTEENTNEIYTVTITKMANAVWSQLTAYDQEVKDISLSINPTNAMPYIGYIANAEEYEDRRLNLISYQDNIWSRIGAADFNSARAKDADLAFSPEGTPLISFGDYSVDPSQVSLMEYTDNSWNYVGQPGISEGERSYRESALVTGEDGAIYNFYIDNDRQLKLKAFDGNAWNTIAISGVNSPSVDLDAVYENGALYVATIDRTTLQSVSVFKYENGNWTTLADQMKEAPENAIRTYRIAMDVDTEGNVYLAYAEDDAAAGTDYQVKVKKYTAASNSWSILGDLIPDASYRSFDIAIDAYDNPMLLYRNASDNPTTLAFDDEVNNWASPVVLSNNEADDVELEYAANGIGYAAYTVGNQLYLHKYDSPDNQ